MTRPLALLPLLAVVACHRSSASDPSHDSAFWSWFAAHQTEVATIEKGNEPPADALARELHKVDPGLTFELQVTSSPHELIVSADGIRKLFPTVTRLVAAAPTIPGWTIIAFRPRHGADLTLEVGNGIKIGASDMLFRSTPAPDGELDVAIYVKTMTTVSDDGKQAVYLELDSILGEYDVETRLAGIDIRPGSSAPADARPIAELAQVVDSRKDAGSVGRSP